MQRISGRSGALALFDVAGTRVIETRAAASLPPHTLMHRAGEATARLALALAPHARRIWIAAGPGNNGGDGLEAARSLKQDGKEVGVLLVGDAASLPADARDAFVRARQAGVAFACDPQGLDRHDLAIDALLGIGATRAPQGALGEAVRRLHALACPVLSIDIPSGLSADTGQPFGECSVHATHTLALLTAKPGLFTGSGRDHAGSVWLDGLGAEAFFRADPAAADGDRDGATAVAFLPDPAASTLGGGARAHASHKGSFGDVAVVGGAPGMRGAALLAARAAHAAGAGRVFVAFVGVDAMAPDHDPLRPELMFRPSWCEGPAEMLASSTVVCGCGGGDAVRSVLPRLISLVGKLLLDADALSAVAADAGLQAMLRGRAARGLPTVLTPHPLEAARLLACNAAEVQADRLRAARALADRFAAVVVLKGSGSVTAAPNRISAINDTGNAALATAGSGDVLAGWLGGLWAQVMGPRDAVTVAFELAVKAVAAHGAAADPPRPGPLRAGDLIEALHRDLRGAR